MAVKQLNATEARNNFFTLLKSSHLHKQKYLISKGDIPMVYIVPVDESNVERTEDVQKEQLKMLNQAKKLRRSIRSNIDSVKLIREIREHGK